MISNSVSKRSSMSAQLCAGRELELDLDPIDRAALAGPGNGFGRRDERDGPDGDILAQARVDLPLAPPVQERAVHVLCPPRHRVAGVHVLRSEEHTSELQSLTNL